MVESLWDPVGSNPQVHAVLRRHLHLGRRASGPLGSPGRFDHRVSVGGTYPRKVGDLVWGITGGEWMVRGRGERGGGRVGSILQLLWHSAAALRSGDAACVMQRHRIGAPHLASGGPWPRRLPQSERGSSLGASPRAFGSSPPSSPRKAPPSPRRLATPKARRSARFTPLRPRTGPRTWGAGTPSTGTWSRTGASATCGTAGCARSSSSSPRSWAGRFDIPAA